MLSSKCFKYILIISNLLLLVSCATTNNNEELESGTLVNEEQVDEKTSLTNSTNAKDESEINQVNSDSQAQAVFDPNLVDPMEAKDLPLPLIQGYDKTATLLNKNENDKAIIELELLQAQYPEFSGPSYRLARIYRDKKYIDQALKLVNAAIQIEPLNYYAFNLKGLILREKGDFVEAKQAYLEAIKIYPNFLNSEINLAILADLYLYEQELALAHYERYVQLVADLETLNGIPSNANITSETSESRAKEQKKILGWITDLKRRMPKDKEQ